MLLIDYRSPLQDSLYFGRQIICQFINLLLHFTYPAEISDPPLHVDMAAKHPRYPFATGLSRCAPARFYLLPANTMQLLPKLLCSLPAQVNTGLEEWWLARYWHTSVDNDLRVSDPALIVPVEPLGFFGRRILNEAF